MEAWNNPYVPGAGTPPPELAGRDSLLADARTSIKRNHSMGSTRSFIFVGLRGVGKTVLLNKIQEIAEKENALTDYIEVSSNESLSQSIIPILRTFLLKLDQNGGVNRYVKTGLKVLRSFIDAVRIKIESVEISLDIDPEPGIADSGVLSRDLADIFVAVGEAAKDRNTSIVILADEIQNLPAHEFEALVMALHRTNQKKLPFIVIGAGLPSLIKLAGNARTYAERLFEYPEIGALDYADATSALVEPAQRAQVQFDGNAIQEVIAVTQGYPYFLQEWGYQTWNTAKGTPITLADVKISSELVIRRLDKNFFRSRYERVSDAQKGYLYAMAKCGPGPHQTGHIAQALGKTSQQVSSLREGLIKSGMIYSPKYGHTAFTVPLFDEFMVRIHKSH